MNQPSSINPRPVPVAPVAVLIDGENISSTHVGTILSHARSLGDPLIRRVYGNATRIKEWEREPGLQFVHSGTAKNAADIRITIDAVDLAHSGAAQGFVIVTSDIDFMHLAHFLRERGHHVLGMGEIKALTGFLMACSKFELLKCKKAAPALEPMTDIDRKVIALIKSNNNEMKIALLGTKIYGQHQIKISQQPEITWRAYLLARPKLFDCDPKGPDACVRLTTAAVG